MNKLRTAIAILAVVFSASAAAHADTCITYMGMIYCGPVVDSPEISVSGSITSVVLLMGAILMIRGRQRRTN